MMGVAAPRAKPIVMSAESVRAILAGNKTQTRRVVSCSNSTVLGGASRSLWAHLKWDRPEDTRKDGPGPLGYTEYLHVPAIHPADDDGTDDCLAYYRVRPKWSRGDRLWVRETWSDLRGTGIGTAKFAYKADSLNAWGEEDADAKRTRLDYGVRWRSPRFILKEASRLTLEITDVRVQRVQEISEADAIAEGVRFDGTWWCGAPHKVKGTPRAFPTAREAYADVWDSINAKRGHAWDANPWVWAITFGVVEGDA